jgi:hypothetical protein
MAKAKKKVELPAKEAAAVAALEKFVKAHEGKTLTDAQKKEKKALRETVSGLKFVRIANKRLPRVLGAVGAIGNLGSYAHNEAQTKAIVTALKDAVAEVDAKLSGKKQAAQGFQLPDTDEAPQ